MTSNGTWIEPEWSRRPHTNSLLRFRCTLPIESADVGELDPLHAIVISASATVDMHENADTFLAVSATSGCKHLAARPAESYIWPPTLSTTPALRSSPMVGAGATEVWPTSNMRPSCDGPALSEPYGRGRRDGGVGGTALSLH